MKPPPICELRSGHAHRRRLRGLAGVDHGRFGIGEASIAKASLRSKGKTRSQSAREIFPDIDVLCTDRPLAGWRASTNAAARNQYKSKPHRFGKQIAVSIHHSASRADLSGSVYFA